jgi:diketogulonate reductase-like aldo/keto reductase
MRGSLQSTVTLNSGLPMPILGLGVWRLSPGAETIRVTADALALGYRLIDTAAGYENEHDVGVALRLSEIPRGEVFVTTKLLTEDHGYDSALRGFDTSLGRLGMDYVDLYLIHWPRSAKRGESWRAMEQILASGRARAIGVSNYAERHLTELLEHAGVVPAVNQVEFSVFLFQHQLLEFCRARGIQLEAYAPLTKGRRLEDSRIAAIARHHGRTIPQVMIRWVIQHGVVTIPKTSRRERLVENAQTVEFELTPDEMAALDALNEGYRTTTDPDTIP